MSVQQDFQCRRILKQSSHYLGNPSLPSGLSGPWRYNCRRGLLDISIEDRLNFFENCY